MSSERAHHVLIHVSNLKFYKLMEVFKQNIKVLLPRLLLSTLLFLAIPLVIYLGTPTQSTDIIVSDGVY
jgi:hypothetical protein